MLSMTGYGYAEQSDEECMMSVEIKSYNNRFLEISHNIPTSFSRFEQAMDERIKTVASRGRVELTVRYKLLSHDIQLHVDESAITRYREAFDKIVSIAQLSQGPSLQDFVLSEGVLSTVKELDVTQFESRLFALLDTALVDFRKTKQIEGEATKADLQRLCVALQEDLSVISSHAGTLEQKLREALLQRFDELLGNKGFDEQRFLQEVAVLLTKYSIHEEIMRLGTHITATRALLETAGPMGKKLDFFSQEMNREINTIGSKSIIVEINQQVVSLKDNLENFREQVRNIE